MAAEQTIPFEPCKATKTLFEEAAYFWDGIDGEMYFVEDKSDWLDLGLTVDDWEAFHEELINEDWWETFIEIGEGHPGDPLVTCYMDFVPEYQKYDQVMIDFAKTHVQRYTDLHELAFDLGDTAGMAEAEKVLKDFMKEHPGYIGLRENDTAFLHHKYTNDRTKEGHTPSLSTESRDMRDASSVLKQDTPPQKAPSIEL